MWARDGRELYYRSPSGAVMRVPISALASSLKPGTPTQLFESSSYVFARTGQRSYDVAPDGRFVMLKNTDTSAARTTAPRIVIVQNWFEELKRLVPTK